MTCIRAKLLLLALGRKARAIKGHFRCEPRFSDIPLLSQIARESVRGRYREERSSLDECPRYGNYRSIDNQSHVVFEKIKENLRRGKILIFPRISARETRRLRVSSLGAVVLPRKIRAVHDLMFDSSEGIQKGDVNSRSSVDIPPPCLCAQAVPTLSRELDCFEITSTSHPILGKTDFHDAFRNVGINSDCAQVFPYVFDQFVAVIFRTVFGWTLSPTYPGVPAKSCFFPLQHHAWVNAIVGRRSPNGEPRPDIAEKGTWKPGPNPGRSRGSSGREWIGTDDPFFVVLYMDDVSLVHVQQDYQDESALLVPSSFALEGLRVLGPGVPGEPPILSRRLQI